MSKLTKAERKRFYKKLLHIVCKDPSVLVGFCYYVEDAAVELGGKFQDIIDDHICDSDFIVYELPELVKIKPKDRPMYGYWFDNTAEGWNIRIRKLHKIIQSM